MFVKERIKTEQSCSCGNQIIQKRSNLDYVISDKEIQTALEDDIPNIIKLNSIYEKMEKDNIALECLKLEELDYMLDFVDEVDLLELSIDEFFILFNNKIKEFMEQNEEIKKYLIVE